MITQNSASRNGSKPTRNADLRHAQALGRLRTQHPQMTPQHNAKCIHAIIRKRMAENQPIEDLEQYGLTADDVWCELVDMLSPDELAALNAASPQGEPEGDGPADEPIPYAITTTAEAATDEPAPEADLPLPRWRNEHPKYVHSMDWHDPLGIKHMLVFRSDDLDEVLREARMIQQFIKAAKARDRDAKPESIPTEATDSQAESAHCPQHGTSRLKPSKYGGRYCASRLEDGTYCKHASGRK